MIRGHAVLLPPLLDPLEVDPEFRRDSGARPTEHRKQVVKRLHAPSVTGDGYSLQVGTIDPATSARGPRTLSGMGRGRTPVEFNRLLAQRLRAARIGAGYDKMPPFARLVGVEWETYKKWEQGKTPIPHHHLSRVSELTGKDANFFYGQAREQQVA